MAQPFDGRRQIMTSIASFGIFWGFVVADTTPLRRPRSARPRVNNQRST